MAELPPSIIKRLTKELCELQEKPCEGIRVLINERNIGDVQAELEGPTGTPFESGLFRLRLAIPSDFPQSPPKGYFVTKIFHPNVSSAGEICVNVLKKDWSPDVGIRHILMIIRCLLIEPFPESALNEEAGKLLLGNYEEYARHARLMTSIHAPRKATPLGELTSSGAINGSGAGPTGAGSDGSKRTGEEGESPVKKAKGGLEQKQTAASKVKKSLKRL